MTRKIAKEKEILRSFIRDWLDDDIEKLKDFDLKWLARSKEYGCPDRKFDPDDTTLMRAVYGLVFGRVWKNLSWENSGEGKLRGDTINSSATFFSYPWDDKFTPKWNPPTELSMKIKEFQHTFHTIGNMMVLPDKRIGEWSINKHRGCHDQWHDYEDRFLQALYLVLTNQPKQEPELRALVELNNDDFLPFYGEDGWKAFIDGNLLNDYVNNEYHPVILSKGYTWWKGGFTIKKVFFDEANRYIDDSTRIIHNRADRMIEILNQELTLKVI